MRYLLAIIAPPFALLICKKPIQFIINLVIWLISLPLILALGVGVMGWVLCTMHALIVCVTSSSDKKSSINWLPPSNHAMRARSRRRSDEAVIEKLQQRNCELC